MGLSNSFGSLGRVVGPIFADIIFDLHPNFPHLAGALILCTVLILNLSWIEEQNTLDALPKAL